MLCPKFYFLNVILTILLVACTPDENPVVVGPVIEEVQPAAEPVELTTVPEVPTKVPTEVVSLTPIFELVGIDETKSFTYADLLKLPAASGMAGIKSSTGKITAPLKFIGVTLTTLALQVGVIVEIVEINIVVEDGFSNSYLYDQIMHTNYMY